MKEIESWRNGEWIPNSRIGTNLWDAHYFFGWAVFDAFRTYNHKPHLLKEHIDRLYRSAFLAEISFDMPKKTMIDHVHEVIDHNKEFFPKEEEYRFMIFISPGYFRIYDDMGDPGPIITINATTTSRYAKYIAPHLDSGVTSLISSQRQIPSRFFDPKIKSCSRLHYGIADAEAATYGKDVHPILLDEHGYITESSGSNVGFVKDGQVCLPKGGDMLTGCTMEFIEKECIDSEILRENWEVYDIINADGIFFSSTFSGITPSYEIIYRNKRQKLQGGKPLIEKMIKNFSSHVGVDVNKQWKDWYAKVL
jgi:branched-subunit amino acid aminotransferase/4-amino-4-deoxychorismate lyase